MNCNICDNEFKYIDGLKFCPYCGSKLSMQFVAVEDESNKIDDKAAEEIEEIDQAINLGEKDTEVENAAESEALEAPKSNVHDTLEMPAITDEIINKSKKVRKSGKLSKLALIIKNIVTSKVFIIPFFALVVLGVSGLLAYNFLINTKVEVGQIKVDLPGKSLVLPKGTNYEIKKEYIKELSIVNRVYNKEESVEYIDVDTTLNDGLIEVKGSLQLAYKKEGRSQWKLLDKIDIKKDLSVKAVSGMEEAKLAQGIKLQKISVGSEEISLGDDIVKSVKILQRSPNFEEARETVLAEIVIDGGVLAAKGNIEVDLSFVDENWIINSIKSENDKEYEISLSESLPEDKIIEQIKKSAKEEYVKHSSVFGGKSFLVNDKFVLSTEIQSKNLEDNKKKLNISLKTNSKAGVLNVKLAADYTFDVTLRDLQLESNTKPTVDGVTVNSPSKEKVAASLAGVEMEGRSDFFWWSDNHKITENEANSFKLDEVLTKTGYQNTNYVYGKLTYNDGDGDKTVDVVAMYYLQYDGSKGYVWKLDSIISSESSKYNYYSKQAIKGQ